ncbi:MFS transporter [Alicycliphilus denitrificans]|uniref:MFS transporter n=1 Tax=Alicycliphilus denitrificans TaxID=179636 RepID=UPI00095DBD4D|nr:MFS transporter [Alicycliphilus denitrificans]MBN9575178.1 MFS transporter [Alicycliphilus denitrificans]OJW83766.1 MAG: 4-hydroxybenzoate transporter [Alicycliphilus sp. 69-12]BCN38522.1 MFS transporter [Alicycliphilus denitrificans]
MTAHSLNPSQAPQINVTELIDRNHIGVRQWMILILCGACMVMDGFDVQAIGYVAPAILQEWNIEKSAMGPVFGAGLSGLLVGSLVLSVLSDKIGRRPVLIASTFFFAVCMLVTPLADNVEHLVILRFVTGLGLGAIMPNTMALCGEFSPQRRRVFVMMLISCGFTVGAMLGGMIAAALIPSFGWKSVFYAGGAIPLVIAITMMFWLPESVQFQALHGVPAGRILPVVRRLLPQEHIPANAEIARPAAKPKGAPMVRLFAEGRTTGTLTIWCISFLNMIGLYFLSQWLPTLAKGAGLTIQTAVLLGTMLQLGGTIGTILMGALIDKYGFKPVLLGCFMLAFISVASIGHASNELVLLFTSVFVAGFMVIGGQPAINALAASYYPTALRTTGVGWSLGVGRIGSVLGPVVGGQLIALSWSQANLFHVVAIPSLLILGLLLFGVQVAHKPLSAAEAPAAH